MFVHLVGFSSPELTSKLIVAVCTHYVFYNVFFSLGLKLFVGPGVVYSSGLEETVLFKVTMILVRGPWLFLLFTAYTVLIMKLLGCPFLWNSERGISSPFLQFHCAADSFRSY